jgi:hypothetical protein
MGKVWGFGFCASRIKDFLKDMIEIESFEWQFATVHQ